MAKQLELNGRQYWILSEPEADGWKAIVLEMKETVFENSPDIHLHRFSDGTYLFPRPQTFPASRIARVDWPNE